MPHETALPRFRASALLCVLIPSSCIEPKTTTEEESGLYEAACPDDVTCDLVLHVDTADLISCFGFDLGTGTWPGGQPSLVYDPGCADPQYQSECTWTYAEEEIGAVQDPQALECYCASGPPATLTVDDCCDSQPTLPSDSDVTELIDALELCGLFNWSLTTENCVWDDPVLDWVSAPEENCGTDPTGWAVPATATQVMYVDPDLSFINLQYAGGSETFPVVGGGTARTTTDQFLNANVWAEDGTVGSYVLQGWSLWATSPIEYDAQSGQFVVHDNDGPVFRGSGRIGGEIYSLETEMGQSAYGEIHSVAETWEADFVETSGGWTITIHLEGAFDDL